MPAADLQITPNRRSQPLITNRKCQLYPRSSLSGKTPSKTTGNAGDEPRVSMDGADKSPAPSIPGPDCTPRQSSGYGRCFARSRRWAVPKKLDRGHRTGLTHAENGRLHGVSQRTSTYAQALCKKMRTAELQIHLKGGGLPNRENSYI